MGDECRLRVTAAGTAVRPLHRDAHVHGDRPVKSLGLRRSSPRLSSQWSGGRWKPGRRSGGCPRRQPVAPRDEGSVGRIHLRPEPGRAAARRLRDAGRLRAYPPRQAADQGCARRRGLVADGRQVAPRSTCNCFASADCETAGDGDAGRPSGARPPRDATAGGQEGARPPPGRRRRPRPRRTIVHRLVPQALSVRPDGKTRVFALRLVNRGNVGERIGGARVALVLRRSGKVFATLRAHRFDLLPHSAGVAQFVYRGSVRGAVAAQVVFRPATEGTTRTFRVTLR